MKNSIVRLFGAHPSALREVSRSGRGLRAGERIVFAIEPTDLAECSEADLLRDLHRVIKQLRAVWDVRARPSAAALEVYRLKQQGKTIRQIANHFSAGWPDCTDVESAERRVNRYVRQVRAFLARATERELAGLTARQRGILAVWDAYDQRRTRVRAARAQR
jgi:hypothetical protein